MSRLPPSPLFVQPAGFSPPALADGSDGVTTRQLFIVSELLALDEDYDAVTEAVFPEPITSSEVDDHLDGFRPESGATPDTDTPGDQGTGEPVGGGR